MDLNWSTADLRFRDEVRRFLEHKLTPELRRAGRLMTSVYADDTACLQWQRILAQHGWGAPSWPKAYGGCEWTPLQRYIFARERVAAGAPPAPFSLHTIGPALIAFGSKEQKRRFLPPLLYGEHRWCQGYSEPESGSDLASLQMSAIDMGDELVCSGSKIWTTHAHTADWMFCLARTSREGRPQQGISFLLIDMRTPGVSVRPIVMFSGEHIQNQVFFDQVRVPKSQVVGGIGRGWTVAKYLLEYERSGVAYTPELHARLDELRNFAAQVPVDGGTLLDQPLFAARLAEARVRVSTLEIYELRTMSALSSGTSPGNAASVMKILGTEISQQITELAMDAAGVYAQAYQPHAGRPGGAIHLPHNPDHVAGPTVASLAPLRYLNDRAGSIYAGTNEIQRNILVKTALRL
ncbi:acyl-CoA dehydrogenase family protein [Sinimarinibacterium thermocellulolyticum]|uniref:Acyl-CoA dehydrogenase family protein n=1 Tax=Sinimarinibacterium thermocellulolyticum TaxID=3170016 RepID=A0ABV2ADT4_9GAMM